jgi:RNA-binding protein Musashi
MAMQAMMGGGGPGAQGPAGGFNSQQGIQLAAPNMGPRPAYTPQDQLAFEQQKYEQQQQRRMQQQSGFGGQGGPPAWDGMYEDMPQPPSGPGGRGGGFKGNPRGRQGSSQPPAGPANAPINAPTGPKNAGKPGANYRGGGRHTGGFRHQPYGGRGG